MKIVINGIEQESDCVSLSELWEVESREKEIEIPRGFAIALNGRLVRRDEWPETPIAAGDRIEIVRAFAGG
jgi:sulfur carrier protein